MMPIPLSFSNLWLGLLDQKHYTWKNHETQSPTNQTLKDEIRKKIIKITRIEIKIKNKLEDNYNFFLLESEIEKKINFNKKDKNKSKEWGLDWKI